MRLTEKEITAIRERFTAEFGSGRLYLFGSRTDDSRRGGDIDLYIEPADTHGLTRRKIAFLAALKREIGERKIDVVIDRGRRRPIDRVAKTEGVLLCEN